jgi:hypothetical protein
LLALLFIFIFFIYRLCDELLTVEKRLLCILEAAFSERQERIRPFYNNASASNHLQQQQNLLLSSTNDDSGIGSGGTLANASK